MSDNYANIVRFFKENFNFEKIIRIITILIITINTILLVYSFKVSRQFIKFISMSVIIIESTINIKMYLPKIMFGLKVINGFLIKCLMIFLIIRQIVYKYNCIKENPFKLKYDLTIYVFRGICIWLSYIIVSSIVLIKGIDVSILPTIFYKSYILEIQKAINLYLYSLIFLLIIMLGIYIMLNIKNKPTGKEDRTCYKEELEIEIYRYLEEKNQMGFMVYGEWGVGKTYRVKKCIDKYLRYRNKKYYYISCFGLTSRNAVLNELKNIYSKQDDSIRKKIAECMRVIPVVGELLYSWFQPEYEFKDMKKGSIFIFDDLERVSILLDKPKGMQQDNIRNMDLREREVLQYDRYNKFNIVTGIINELICMYGMKVIIICNKGELDQYSKIFSEKLACKMFNIKMNTEELLKRLAQNHIENNISLEEEKVIFLKDFFDKNNSDIYDLWNKTKIENLRFYNGIIIAFVDIINILNQESFNKYKEYAKNIFFTIFWGHIYYYKKNDYRYEEEIYKWCHEDESKFYLNNLDGIKNGQDIYIYKYKKLNFSYSPIFEYIISKDKVFWCGDEIAYSWINGNILEENCIISELEKTINYEGYIEECLNNIGNDTSKIMELSKNVSIEDFLVVISILSERDNIKLINSDIESILNDLIKYDKEIYINECNRLYEIKNIVYDNPEGLAKHILDLLDIFNKYGIFTNIYKYKLNKDIIFERLKNTYPQVGKFNDMDVTGAYRARRINPLVAEFEKFIEK